MPSQPLLPAHPRRAFLRHAGLWAVGTALSPTAWPAAPLWPVTVAVAQPHAMAHMPLVLAHALGYFQGEGLQVTLISHATEDSAVQSVLQGRAAVVACTYAHTLSQHALGGDMQAFLLQLRAPQVVLGASLKTLGHYRSPADLRANGWGSWHRRHRGSWCWAACCTAQGSNPPTPHWRCSTVQPNCSPGTARANWTS